jgi:hypothetical protein
MEEIMKLFEQQSAVDYIGLWQVIDAAKRELNEGASSGIQRLTLELVKSMLNHGFRAGDLAESDGFNAWPNQNSDLILHKIESEWSALGREPNIGDIAWFDSIR